jgi:predicted signal transduction protein with EAL and GGDEF domain
MTHTSRQPRADPLQQSVADGTEIWVLMNVSLVTDLRGEAVIEATLIDISDRKRAEEQIRYQAHHDILTGLPNRALFKDRLIIALNYARRHGNQMAVLSLDLDQFTVVNDTYGRAVGAAQRSFEVAQRSLSSQTCEHRLAVAITPVEIEDSTGHQAVA